MHRTFIDTCNGITKWWNILGVSITQCHAWIFTMNGKLPPVQGQGGGWKTFFCKFEPVSIFWTHHNHLEPVTICHQICDSYCWWRSEALTMYCSVASNVCCMRSFAFLVRDFWHWLIAALKLFWIWRAFAKSQQRILHLYIQQMHITALILSCSLVFLPVIMISDNSPSYHYTELHLTSNTKNIGES